MNVLYGYNKARLCTGRFFSYEIVSQVLKQEKVGKKNGFFCKSNAEKLLHKIRKCNKINLEKIREFSNTSLDWESAIMK